jgi:hypothetical protein
VILIFCYICQSGFYRGGLLKGMKRHPFLGAEKNTKKIAYNPTELAKGMPNVFKISI